MKPSRLVRGLLVSLAVPLALALLLYTRDPAPEWAASAVLGAWIGCAAGLVAWGAVQGARPGSDTRGR